MANLTEIATPTSTAALAAQNKSPSNLSSQQGGAASSTQTSTDDPFWFQPDINNAEWSKLYPFQLLIVKQNSDGQYTQDNNWAFTLPIPPESLTNDTPFAINVEATQGGIVEEHNGVIFKQIVLSGTTGVLPLRGTNLNAPITSGLAGILGGTIQALQNTVNTVQRTASSFTGSQNSQSALVTADEINGDVGDVSGYTQFLQLQRFLERYVNIKKLSVGRPYRLAFAIWKEKSVYLVTPQRFSLARTSSSPMEYPYSLSLKVWRRINLSASPKPIPNYIPPTRNINAVSALLQTAINCRNILAGIGNTITAVGLDLDHSFLEPLRQSINFCKDLTGVAQTAIDLPTQIISDIRDTVTLALSTKQGFQEFSDNAKKQGNEYSTQWDDVVKTAKQVVAGAQEKSFGNTLNATLLDIPTNVANPADDPFLHPSDNIAFFDSISIASLPLRPQLTAKIAQDRAKTQSLTRQNWEDTANTASQVLTNYENAVGAGSPVVTYIYGGSSNSTTNTPTDLDYDIIQTLNDAVNVFYQFAVSDSTNITNENSVLTGIANFAQQNGIAFNIPNSKFLVPFPYGNTLEDLAYKYLNDPDRWIEIAALNGLDAPYVDELGFDYPLLIDGKDDQVVVSSADNLFIGQPISVISNITIKTTRTIQKITKIDDSYYIILLSGDPNLDSYKVANNATLHAFLPNTVNSQMSLYIPSDEEPLFDNFVYKPIPGLKDLDVYFNVGGTDLLLTDKNDIVLTPDGDTPIAIGLNSIIQDIRIRIGTPRGSLILHPSFGLPLNVGDSLSDISAKTTLQAITDLFNDDPTYSGVSGASVSLVGPVARLGFTVGIRGVAQNIPISLTLV